MEHFDAAINLRQFTICKVSHHCLALHSFCAEKWEGSALLMGTMYSFDIFAAMPCCTERLKVSGRYQGQLMMRILRQRRSIIGFIFLFSAVMKMIIFPEVHVVHAAGLKTKLQRALKLILTSAMLRRSSHWILIIKMYHLSG